MKAILQAYIDRKNQMFISYCIAKVRQLAPVLNCNIYYVFSTTKQSTVKYQLTEVLYISKQYYKKVSCLQVL